MAPSTPLAGDVFLITGGDSHVQFAVTPTNVQELAYLSDVTASNNSVAAETARATAAEGVLTGSINAEVTRATAAETTLAASITSDEAAISAANTAISTETSRATAAELLKANLAGGNTFTTGEQILAASTTGYASINVPSGVAPSTPLAGDVFLITGGDSHVQFAVTPTNVQELAYLSDVTASNNSVAAETARAIAAEGVLTGSINAEVTRATAAETTLAASITSDEAAISAANTAISTKPAALLRLNCSRPTWLAATPSPLASRSWRLRLPAMPRSTFHPAWLLLHRWLVTCS